MSLEPAQERALEDLHSYFEEALTKGDRAVAQSVISEVELLAGSPLALPLVKRLERWDTENVKSLEKHEQGRRHQRSA